MKHYIRHHLKVSRSILRAEWRRKRIKKQRNRCAMCDKTFDSGNPPTLDHIIPLSKGGRDHWENTQAVCKPCNETKGNRLAIDLLRSTA